MRKLVIFCFAVCMTVLTVLSLFNFAQDAEESMILDKRAVILEKPETLSNREFLGQIDTALGKIGADIMYRYAELDGDKPLYRYYKTSHTDSFLSVSTGKGSVRLESDEFFPLQGSRELWRCICPRCFKIPPSIHSCRRSSMT